MDIDNLSALTRNVHFLRFVALLSVPQAAGWRMEHPEVPPVRNTLNRLMRLRKGLPARTAQEDFMNEFSPLIQRLVEADTNLHYYTDDMDWITQSISSEDAPLIFSLLFAYASCPVHWYTAEQVSTFTNNAPSTWRMRAANGEIIGAKMVGKTWLFPESGLVAYGVQLPPPMTIEVEQE